MSKYFHQDNIQFTESEDIGKIMKRADKKPENFIRIALNADCLKIDFESKAEFEIFSAIIFYFKKDGKIIRYDFEQGDPDRTFYAAIDRDSFMAVSLQDPVYPLEEFFMFNSSEAVLGIFKASESTIFILYDGTSDNVGYGYFQEKHGYPSIYPRLMQLFDVSRPVRSEENITESA